MRIYSFYSECKTRNFIPACSFTEKKQQKCGNCDALGLQLETALITNLPGLYTKFEVGKPIRFTADTLRYAVALTFDLLTLNVSTVLAVQWSLPNFSEIEQSTAGLLMIEQFLRPIFRGLVLVVPSWSLWWRHTKGLLKTRDWKTRERIWYGKPIKSKLVVFPEWLLLVFLVTCVLLFALWSLGTTPSESIKSEALRSR